MRMEDEKVFVAGEADLDESHQFVFPDVDGLEYLGGEDCPPAVESSGALSQIISANKATCITISFQASGFMQVQPVQAAVLAGFGFGPKLAGCLEAGGDATDLLTLQEQPSLAPGVGLVDLRFTAGFAMWLLRPLMIGSICASVPAPVRPYTYAKWERYPAKVEDFVEDSRIHNSMMGHTVIVDGEGRVRWRCHQHLATSELQAVVPVLERVSGVQRLRDVSAAQLVGEVGAAAPLPPKRRDEATDR